MSTEYTEGTLPPSDCDCEMVFSQYNDMDSPFGGCDGMKIKVVAHSNGHAIYVYTFEGELRSHTSSNPRHFRRIKSVKEIEMDDYVTWCRGLLSDGDLGADGESGFYRFVDLQFKAGARVPDKKS